MAISVKRVRALDVTSSQDDLEQRYREVRGLRQQVAQFETSLCDKAPRTAIEKFIPHFRAAARRANRRVRTLH